MEAIIFAPGDRSVGINDYSLIIDLGDEKFDGYDECREEFRQKLVEAFGCLTDPAPKVTFSDEVPGNEEPDEAIKEDLCEFVDDLDPRFYAIWSESGRPWYEVYQRAKQLGWRDP